MRTFGAGGALRPSDPNGRIKVTDHIVWINVIPMDGVPRRIPAFKGESLLNALERHRTPGIFSDCSGGDREGTMEPFQIPYDYYSMGVHCGQCSVVIPDPWADKVNGIYSSEERVLGRKNEGNAEQSRLACCIQVRPELNEMICVVGNNISEASGDVYAV